MVRKKTAYHAIICLSDDKEGSEYKICKNVVQTQTYISKGLLQNVANITLSKMDQWWLFSIHMTLVLRGSSCKILARGVQSQKNGSHLEG